MIRYDVAEADLNDKINKESPTWFTRTKKRTIAFRKNKKYIEKTGIWSEIKAVYMKLQHNKCAYCERVLEGPPYGLVEHDVEHFRPKNGVEEWPSAKIKADRKINYDFSTGDDWDAGYYLLAYHPRNYITACKSCNTPLKLSYFPIAGKRGPQAEDPSDLATEQPFLLYPIGKIDDNPEEILTFEGVVPKPVKKSGHRRRRAVVTIDFFELDTREELIRGRSEVIRTIWAALLVLETHPTPANKNFAHKALATTLSEASPHSNCARSFRKLYEQDRAKAEVLANAALIYLEEIKA